MVERQVEWQYPIMAALITALLMSGIFIAGLQLSDYKVNQLQERVETMEVEQDSRLIGQRLSSNLDEDNCRSMSAWMNSTVDDLRVLRKEVASYESGNKIENQRYELVKKQYMNLLLQNLVQVRKFDRNCDREIVDVIYFYEDNCDRCQDQGVVLTDVRQQYEREVVVYPLDTELGMPPITFMQEYYGIENYPSLVIEGQVNQSFMSEPELRNAIENRINSTES